MNKIILAAVLSAIPAPSSHAYADPLQAPGLAAPQQHSFGGGRSAADPPVAVQPDAWNEA
jgi:hypothetical protein